MYIFCDTTLQFETTLEKICILLVAEEDPVNRLQPMFSVKNA